jgi:Sulfotransferase family
MIGTRHDYYTAPAKHLAYLEIPKCACTSLKRAIASLLLDEVAPGVKIHHEFPASYVLNHPGIDRSNYFTFTFVRDPVERFFSFYRGKVLDGWDEFIAPALGRVGIDRAMGISEAIDALRSHDPASWERHVRPQRLFLLSDEGQLMVDFIGRFERFDRDWSRLSVLTQTEIALGRENPSLEYKPIVVRPSEYLALCELYEEDFKLLGYEPVQFADIPTAYGRYGITTPEPNRSRSPAGAARPR